MNLVKKILFWLVFSVSSLRLVPHMLVMKFGSGRALISADVARWADIYMDEIYIEKTPATILNELYAFSVLMTWYREFRNLFYYRAGLPGKLFRPLCRTQSTLSIQAGKIGPGLFIQHGFATIISAREIGSNCWINQQVTIGWRDKSGNPVIGDNVTINAGAKVLGKIIIGSNSTVGANAVVVKNVPPNCTVVGVPAYIVRKNGVKLREAL